MTSFDTLQSISSRLNELTNQLSSSRLSKEELVEFETLSRKLYERAVILSYKAKEESVYGKPTDEAMDATFPFSEEEEQEEQEVAEPDSHEEKESVIEETEAIVEGEPEPIIEEPVVEEEPEEEVPVSNQEDNQEEEEDESAAEKSVKEEDGRVQFDFSGGFDTAKAEERSTPEPEPEPEMEPEPVIENTDSYEEESVDEVDEDTVNEEPIEEPKAKAVEAKIEEHTPQQEGPIEEKNEESIAQKEETIVQQESQPSLDEMLQGNDDKISSFYARFSKAYNAAAGDKLGTSRIISLKGAIGLNDRLQFISELFGGDTNLYNETLDNLDQLESSEQALRKLSEIAAKGNWNKDDASVDEFAHFITRRYVD